MDAPEPFRVYLYHPTNGWAAWTTVFFVEEFECGFDYCELYDAFIEQGSANSSTRFLVDFYDNGTDFITAAMYENYQYHMCYDDYADNGSYQRILSEYPININWVDNQIIAIIGAEDGASHVGVFLRVQLYIIGK